MVACRRGGRVRGGRWGGQAEHHLLSKLTSLTAFRSPGQMKSEEVLVSFGEIWILATGAGAGAGAKNRVRTRNGTPWVHLCPAQGPIWLQATERPVCLKRQLPVSDETQSWWHLISKKALGNETGGLFHEGRHISRGAATQQEACSEEPNGLIRGLSVLCLRTEGAEGT